MLQVLETWAAASGLCIAKPMVQLPNEGCHIMLATQLLTNAQWPYTTGNSQVLWHTWLEACSSKGCGHMVAAMLELAPAHCCLLTGGGLICPHHSYSIRASVAQSCLGDVELGTRQPAHSIWGVRTLKYPTAPKVLRAVAVVDGACRWDHDVYTSSQLVLLLQA